MIRQILICVATLLINTSVVYSQDTPVIKFRTTDFAFMYKEANDHWTDWTDWEEANILVVFDTVKERITIFSNETQVYDIATSEGKSKNSAGDEIYSFLCIDKDGAQCQVQLWKRPNEDNSFYNQLYINFSDLRYVYNFYSID